MNVSGSGNALNSESVTNTDGNLTIDGAATLTLNGATITAGTVTNGGEFDLPGNAVLQNGILVSSGWITVGGAGKALHNESVPVKNTLDVLGGGRLTIDQGA